MMSTQGRIILALAALVCSIGGLVEAGQGCPFDDGSCQEYCNQQGCNMGYCGHFAWTQCICRKCGDEWNWYDKVRYNPDKTVNQTELDSLKLNGTAPMILTNSNNVTKSEQEQQQQQKRPATLTTLLIPDLSDSNKLADLNDIPDENSDKFLDYLAKNHDKLVQATSARTTSSDSTQSTPSTTIVQNQQQQQQSQASGELILESADDEEASDLTTNSTDDEQTIQSTTTTTTSQTPTTQMTTDDETVEIQISSNNNNSQPATTNNNRPMESQLMMGAASTASQSQTEQQKPGSAQVSSLKHLIKVAVFGPDPDVF